MARQQRRGQSVVEFAIMLPLLVVLLVSVIQFGFLFGYQLSLQHAALVGVRTAALTKDNAKATTAAKAAASPWVSLSDSDVQFSTFTVQNPDDSIRVTCGHSFQLIFPAFFSQNPYPLTASTVMRKE